jgi:hypothetical protein
MQKSLVVVVLPVVAVAAATVGQLISCRNTSCRNTMGEVIGFIAVDGKRFDGKR